MTKELLEMYHKCRAKKPFMLVGSDAKCSLESARAIIRFRELEDEGLVRLRAEPEEERYDYGDMLTHSTRNGHPVPYEKAKEEMDEILERDGVWYTVAEWWDGEEWQQADSCGMHAGYSDPLDPFENCYIIGHMESAIKAVENHQAEQEETELAECWP